MNTDDAAIFAALDGPLTGAEVLDLVEDTLTRYVVFPSPEAADAVTLYIAATHGQPSWQHATRLVVKSAEKRCGKTRVLILIFEKQLLRRRRPPTSSLS